MISIPEYIKVKDKYCIVYFGESKEYIVQLRLLRPIIEKTFQGLQIYLACKDDYIYLLKDEPRILTASQLKENKNQFAYVREIFCNLNEHPVEQLLIESDISITPICESSIHVENVRGSCLLLPHAHAPTRSLNSRQISDVILHVEKQGFSVHFNKKINDFDWILGVENESLYEAAALGKRITLVPTGFGENLFRKMFPLAEILYV